MAHRRHLLTLLQYGEELTVAYQPDECCNPTAKTERERCPYCPKNSKVKNKTPVPSPVPNKKTEPKKPAWLQALYGDTFTP